MTQQNNDGFGAFDIVLLVCSVIVLSLFVYLNSQIKPDPLPDHCKPDWKAK